MVVALASVESWRRRALFTAFGEPFSRRGAIGPSRDSGREPLGGQRRGRRAAPRSVPACRLRPSGVVPGSGAEHRLRYACMSRRDGQRHRLDRGSVEAMGRNGLLGIFPKLGQAIARGDRAGTRSFPRRTLEVKRSRWRTNLILQSGQPEARSRPWTDLYLRRECGWSRLRPS